MRKIMIVGVLTSLIMLTGCNGNPQSSVSSSFLSSTSQSKDDIDENTYYESNTWDEKINRIIAFSIGDGYKAIPVVRADHYAAYTSIQSDGYGGTYKIAVIDCYPVEAGIEDDLEEYLINETKWVYSSSSYCYFFKASKLDDLQMAFGVGSSSVGNVLEIQVARFTTRKANWEESLGEVMFGFQIPEYKAESYEYYVDYGPIGTNGNYYTTATCYLNNVDELVALTDYKKLILDSNRWNLSIDDAYGYTFTSKDGWCKLQVYGEVSAYSEYCLCLVLDNEWPLYMLHSFLGEDLPKLAANLGDYDGYGLQDNGDSVCLGIYYYSDLTGYNLYLSSLKSAGWIYETEKESYTSPDYGTVNYSIMVKVVEGVNKEVEILHSSALGALYIIVF